MLGTYRFGPATYRLPKCGARDPSDESAQCPDRFRVPIGSGSRWVPAAVNRQAIRTRQAGQSQSTSDRELLLIGSGRGIRVIRRTQLSVQRLQLLFDFRQLRFDVLRLVLQHAVNENGVDQ
jgi:hypothetical protein